MLASVKANTKPVRLLSNDSVGYTLQIKPKHGQWCFCYGGMDVHGFDRLRTVSGGRPIALSKCKRQ